MNLLANLWGRLWAKRRHVMTDAFCLWPLSPSPADCDRTFEQIVDRYGMRVEAACGESIRIHGTTDVRVPTSRRLRVCLYAASARAEARRVAAFLAGLRAEEAGVLASLLTQAYRPVRVSDAAPDVRRLTRAACGDWVEERGGRRRWVTNVPVKRAGIGLKTTCRVVRMPFDRTWKVGDVARISQPTEAGRSDFRIVDIRPCPMNKKVPCVWFLYRNAAGERLIPAGAGNLFHSNRTEEAVRLLAGTGVDFVREGDIPQELLVTTAWPSDDEPQDAGTAAGEGVDG